MKKVCEKDVQAELRTYLDESRNGPVVVTRHGKAVAAIVAMKSNEDLEDLAYAYSPRLQEILERGRQQIREGKTVQLDQLRAEFGGPKRKKVANSKQSLKGRRNTGRLSNK